MALIADDAQDRAEQLLALTERLSGLIVEETRRIQARAPLLDGAEGEEKNRLVNAYRLELARIGQDRSLINSAPQPLLDALRAQTQTLQDTLAAHETELAAVKLVAEGMVQAMAEELTAQRSGGGYGARGAPTSPVSPQPALLDRSA